MHIQRLKTNPGSEIRMRFPSLAPWRIGIPLRILLLVLAAFFPVQSVHAQETYDVIIRNGKVFDGMGNPWFHADVALNGDRIAAVGDLSDARGLEEIDAEGLFVAPGLSSTPIPMPAAVWRLRV